MDFGFIIMKILNDYKKKKMKNKRGSGKYIITLYITIVTAVSFLLAGCGLLMDEPASGVDVSNEVISEMKQNSDNALKAEGTEMPQSEHPSGEKEIAEEGHEDIEELEATTEAFKETVEHVEILAVGDNLIHTGLYQTGMHESGVWNYDHLYANVEHKIEAADIAIINQETIFIEDRNKISAYPVFGSPTEIADSVARAGFDVVLHASNHTMDKGREGVWDTLNFWKNNYPEVTVLGIHESEEDQDTISVVECKGITFAMLNYTYGLNGFSVPADEPYLVDLLDKERVEADIAKAKEAADMVMVFCHVGDEYVYEPSEYAKQWVDFLLEQEVDIVINAHPHVLEPYTMLTGENGHQMLVYYSVGNFISTQDQIPRLLGGMAEITIEVRNHADGIDYQIIDYGMEPVVAHWNYGTMEFGVYMLENYTNELAAKHGILKKVDEPFSVEILWQMYEEFLSTPISPAKGKLQ